MRRLAFSFMVMIGLSACGGLEPAPLTTTTITTTTEPHNDPECAFDETGCLPAELILTITATDAGPAAFLRATAPVEWTSWTQEGVLTRVHWEDSDGKRLVEDHGPDMVAVQAEAGAVAPRVELWLETDADDVIMEIAGGGEGDSFEPFQEIEVTNESAVFPLDPGIYLLRIRATWPGGDAEFIFAVRRA